MRRIHLFALVGLILAAGCTSDDADITGAAALATTTSSSTTTSTAPVITTTAAPPPPNRVVIGIDMMPDSLNPLAPDGGDQIVAEINQAIGIGLTETQGETLELVPDLAVEIPSITNGGVTVADDGTTTVTFRLRDEAVWEDGIPISGDDVVFTYETIMALEDRARLTEPYEAITSIEATPKTVVITFGEPTLAFETMFPFVVPRHQVQGTDPISDWLETPWMSAGPFRFESWENDTITLARNDAFWKVDPDTGAALPHLDRLIFKWIPETSALIDAFAAGEIDVLVPPPWPATIDRLSKIEGVEITIRDSPIWEHFTFQFGERNRNPDSLNRYVEFRRAVAHLIDPAAILELGFWGTKTSIDSILELHGVATDNPWAAYPFNPAEAKRLLADLCSDLGRDCEADPLRVVFSTTGNADERPAIARLLVDMLALGGIEVELELEDSMLFFGSTLDHGTWDLGMWAWVAQPNPQGVLGTLEVYDPNGPVTGETEGNNFVRWGTPEVSGFGDRLDQGPSQVRDEHTRRYAEILDEMRSTADRDLFFELAREAEQILADQMVTIPLLTRASVGAVWADRVQGYIHSPWSSTWNVEKWNRADF